MRVLVTNDDGVDAPGIAALAAAVTDHDHEAVVVAPLDERSGASSAIGTLAEATTLRRERRSLSGLEHVEVHGLEAAPALCVISARLGAFGEVPDVVVAGINPGLNTGRSILHSGTVGAALTAANHGLSGLAVSQAGQQPRHWATAAALAVDALEWLLAAPLRTVINLNVPDLPLEEVKGICWARPAPIGEWHAVVSGSSDDHVSFGLRRTDVELPADSDTALVAAGYAAVTLLHPPSAAEWAPVADHLERRLGGRLASPAPSDAARARAADEERSA